MPSPSPAGSEAVAARPGIERPALRIATAADVSRLADVLADAFIHDPLYTWMLPRMLPLKPRLRATFTAEMECYGLRQGTVWTTLDYDGAVIELPPGAWEMPTSMTGKEALKWAAGVRDAIAARGKGAAGDGSATSSRAPLLPADRRGTNGAPKTGPRIGAHAADAPESRFRRATGIHRGQYPAQRCTVRAARLCAHRRA